MKYQHSSWHILEMIHAEEPKLLQNDKDGKMVSKCQNDEKTLMGQTLEGSKIQIRKRGRNCFPLNE